MLIKRNLNSLAFNTGQVCQSDRVPEAVRKRRQFLLISGRNVEHIGLERAVEI